MHSHQSQPGGLWPSQGLALPVVICYLYDATACTLSVRRHQLRRVEDVGMGRDRAVSTGLGAPGAGQKSMRIFPKHSEAIMPMATPSILSQHVIHYAFSDLSTKTKECMQMLWAQSCRA